jgi:probable phosphoglycerate mutase
MALRLFFLRHGQTAMSRANVFCGRRLDPPLTPEGIAMAEEFAAAYRELEWRAIYSSPLDRAIATATPLAAAVRLPIERRAELAELD